MRHLIIQKDGLNYDHRELGASFAGFRRPGVNNENEYDSTDNQNGERLIRTKKKGRPLTARFFMESVDFLDRELAIEEFYALFNHHEEFIVIDSMNPSKQWIVQVIGEIPDPDRLNTTHYAMIEVPLYSGYPYSKSIGTSLDPLTFDSELWQIGQGLIAEDVSYRHSTSTFQIYNPSVIDIVPWEHPLVIAIRGRTNGLQLVNETTGDVFKHYGSTGASDVLTLNKIRHLKNGTSCMGETNHKDITLAKGWNKFRTLGLAGAEVSFDFPFFGI